MSTVAHAIADLISLGVVGFVVIAVVSLFRMRPPATPSFARPRAMSSGTGLRRDLNADFFHDRCGLLFRKRFFFVATGCPPVRFTGRHALAQLRVRQLDQPVKVMSSGPRTWWWFKDMFYWDSSGYSDQDVVALVRDRERREHDKLARAHMLLQVEQAQQTGGGGSFRPRRGTLPQAMRRVVFERDGGQCVQCGTTFDLQYDHILPVALGGATTVENLQLLCGTCNRAKSANL